MSTPLNIIYLTNRIDPKIEWFFDSLWNECQFNPEGIRVIVVDFFANDPERRLMIREKAKARFPGLLIVPPKPCVWQGPHRLTKKDFFAASNARNTGIVYADEGSYLVFVDDISVLLPGWLKQVSHGARHGYVLAGAYRKVLKLVVEDGVVADFEDHPSGWDSRWGNRDVWGKLDSGIQSIDGGGLFGCSFGAPLEMLLKVDGLDEMCDSMGGEDYDLGIRLQRAGAPMFYNRNMITLESEEDHHKDPPMLRIIKKMPGTDASIVMLQRVRKEHRIHPLGNVANLIWLRKLYHDHDPKDGMWPYIPKQPTHHWPDNQKLEEMG